MASVLLGLDVIEINGTSVLAGAAGAGLLILLRNSLPTTELYE